MRSNFVLTLVTAFCLMAGPQGLARAEPVTIGSLAASALFGWASGKAIDLVWDPLTRAPNIREMKRQLDLLAARDRDNAAALRALRDALNERMTSQEVEQLLMSALEKLDQRLAQLARRVQEQGRDLERLAGQLGLTGEDLQRLTGRVDALSGRVDNLGGHVGDHERRLRAAEADLDALKRWTPKEQAVRLAVAGFEYLRYGHGREALDHFRKAHAYDEADPGILYGMALAYYRTGDGNSAEHTRTRAVAAERQKTSGAWFDTLLERVQGPERMWLARGRYEPVHGVLASGEIRVPALVSR